MATETPYRKPSPTAPPQRTVVRRADTPDDAARVEAEIAAARQRSLRAQSARVALELEEARRRYDRFLRLAGAFFLLVGLGGLALDVSAIAGGAESITVSRLGPWVLFVGPYLLITGSAGASGKDSLPTWWKVGVVVAFLLGPAVGSDLEVELAVGLADLFYG